MKHEHSVLVPPDYGKRKRESNKTNDSVFDRIYKYYYNSKTRIELDDEEEQIRSRWEAAWFLLVRAQTQKQVADALERMFSISKSLAYDDVDKATMLFGDPKPSVKAAKRVIAESMILRCLSYAEQKGDLFMMNKFIDKYISIHGLKDKGSDAKLEDLLKHFVPTKVIITSDPKSLENKVNDLKQSIMDAMKSVKNSADEN